MRLNLLGQALIRSDLRGAAWPAFAELAAMLARADLCFSDLETAIRSPSAEAPTREGVFLMPPIRQCSMSSTDLSVSLLATANNHVWDLGGGGIIGMLDELDRRGFAHAGAGADLAAAAAPAYRRTAAGMVALVAVASGAIREAPPRARYGPGSTNCAAVGWPRCTPPISRAFSRHRRGGRKDRHRAGLSPQPYSRSRRPVHPAMAARFRASLHRRRRPRSM